MAEFGNKGTSNYSPRETRTLGARVSRGMRRQPHLGETPLSLAVRRLGDTFFLLGRIEPRASECDCKMERKTAVGGITPTRGRHFTQLPGVKEATTLLNEGNTESWRTSSPTSNAR